MENNTKTAVAEKKEQKLKAKEEKAAAKAEKKAEKAAAKAAAEEKSSLSDQLGSAAPEKRRIFRKACNHTARTVLFDMIIMTGVVVIVTAIALAIIMMSNPEIMSALTSGDMETYMQKVSELTSDPTMMVVLFGANAVGALLAHLFAGMLHAKKRGFKPFHCFGEGRITFKLVGGALVLGMGAMYTWAYIYQILQQLIGFTDPMNEASTAQAEALLSFDNIAGVIVYCAYVCIIAPVFEEFLFRGILLRTLSKYHVGFAAFATSLFFGLMHGNLNQVPGAFLAGLVLAYVAIRSGSIRTPILIHMFINTYSTVMGILSINMPELENLLGIISLAFTGACILGSLIILIVNGKKFKWEAADPATNHTLLPKQASRVRFHAVHFFTCFWVLVAIYVYVESCVVNLGKEPLVVQLINLITELAVK